MGDLKRNDPGSNPLVKKIGKSALEQKKLVWLQMDELRSQSVKPVNIKKQD